MGLKQENFVDRVFITTTATGAGAAGLAPTCTFIDEAGNRTGGTVVEMASGWYKITDFTPDADGTWCTEWAVAGAYTIHYPAKEFKVGGGQEADIKAETATIKAKTDNIPAAPATEAKQDTIIGYIDTEIATIAGYLDTEIAAIKAVTDVIPDAGALTTIDTNVDDIETDTSDMQPRIPRITCHMDFWSDIKEEIQIGAGDEGGVIAMGDVVVADIPAGATITRVIAMFLCRAIENTNASGNAVDVATGHIEVKETAAGAYQTAINIPDNAFGVAASTREMGTVMIGDNDISGEVDANDTYTFELDDIGTDQDFLNLNDCQWGLRVYFTV